jgi:orotate phosphoribosyltransferase
MRPSRPWSGRREPPTTRMPPDLAWRVREAALLEGDFVLSSGKRSSFYVDKYLFSTEPTLLRDVAAALAEEIPEGVERLAGVELGAVPLVVAASLGTGLPYVIVRKAAKEYGASAGESIEGELKSGEKVALLEDVVTTGTQAVAAAGRLEEAGVEVAKIVAVLDRREAAGEGLEESLGKFPFAALLRMEDLRVAKED